jgi:hypothetical protein
MEEHKTYSIGTVARKVGVPKYKLRHWCDRYLPEIQKIDIGDSQHRRFMDKVAFHFEDLDNEGNWIPELTDYDDPRAFLIAQETLEQLRGVLGEHELSVLLGQTSMEQYSEITGLSRRGSYRRLSQARPVVEELLESTIA